MSLKLIKTGVAIQYPNAPYKVEIVYKDGTKIYESNIDTSSRKQTIYPWDDSIEYIRWLDE